MNNPVNAIDPGGKLVIFVNGFHFKMTGASPAYWSTKGRPIGFDGAVMARFNDENKRYYDGSIGGFFGGVREGNTSAPNRSYHGHLSGEADAASIIANLKHNDKGEITETIKVITHSMGAAYAKGFIRALVEYAKKNPELCVGLSISEYDFAPYQPTSQHAVKGVSTFQYSHSEDPFAHDGKISGAEYMDTSADRSQGHPISSFYNQIISLPEGKYVFINGEPVKVD